MPHDAVQETRLPGLLRRQGKVRDIYDLGDRLLLVSSDRISAFDWVLPTPIPDKGRALTRLAAFWFDRLGVEHHLLSTDVAEIPEIPPESRETFAGRTMLVRKTQVVPIECVVRGYLAGSGWREYQETQAVCGVPLPAGLVESDRLPEPIFTPATKAEEGHDENISFERMAELVGADLAQDLKRRSLELYRKGASAAEARGLIIADTKFEWGRLDGKLLLIDEVFTSDSSRFWPADAYHPGGPQPSFDKQFVRDWLSTTDWDKNSPPPPLPPEIVEQTRDKYIEAYERLTGEAFAGR